MMQGDPGQPGALGAPPPPERGRVGEGIKAGSRFDRTEQKTAFARRLRRGSTDVEARLWQKLRRNQIDGCSFRRQHPAGRYVLDFYCPSLGLAIELDGGQHNEASHAARDAQRDAWLADRGVVVLRFWNSDVTQNLSGVLEVIAAKISELKARQVSPTRRWRAGTQEG